MTLCHILPERRGWLIWSFRYKKAVAEDQLHWENRNLSCAENLKLARARKPTLSSRIVVVYPRLNEGECVSTLVHSQHKLDSVMGGEAQSQRKNTASMASSNKKTNKRIHFYKENESFHGKIKQHFKKKRKEKKKKDKRASCVQLRTIYYQDYQVIKNE